MYLNWYPIEDLGIRVIQLRGRFREEVNYKLLDAANAEVARIKFFTGRPPHYGRWIEVFSINPTVVTIKGTVKFHGSPLETTLLGILSETLGPGDVIYVEYIEDLETKIQLQRGYPPFLSRLGYVLLKLGFTWLKDWYYPEGGWEGNPKLEGVKPANAEEKARDWLRIISESSRFAASAGESDEYYRRARDRAVEIIQGVRNL